MQNKLVIARGRRQEGIESNCFIDTEFPFGKLKKFWRRRQNIIMYLKPLTVLPREISVTSDMQMTPPLLQRVERN